MLKDIRGLAPLLIGWCACSEAATESSPDGAETDSLDPNGQQEEVDADADVANPVESPPRGAFHAQIEFSSLPDSASCGLPSVGAVGAPPPSFPSGDDDVVLGALVMQGQEASGGGDYLVSCTVDGGGQGAVQLEIGGPNDAAESPPNSGEVFLRIHGSLGEAGTGEGTVVVRTTESGATTSHSAVPCELQALDQAQAERDAAFTFSCPHAMTPLDEFGVCQLAGVVVVEGCE